MRRYLLRIVSIVILFVDMSAKTLVVDNNSGPFPMPFPMWSCENGDFGCFGITHMQPNCNFSTISEALEFLEEGDTIRICPGDYNESGLKIDKNNVLLQSTTGKTEDVHVGTNTGEDIFILDGFREGVSFDSFTIKQQSSSAAAIVVNGGEDIQFDRLSIESEGYGIDQNSSNVSNLDTFSIHESNISSKKSSLRLIMPENLEITSVRMSSEEDYAIYLKQPSGDVNISADSASRNTFSSRSSCIYLGETSHNYYISHSDFNITGVNSAAVTFDKSDKLEIYDISVNANNKGVGVWSSGSVSGDFSLKDSSIDNSKNEALYIAKVNGKVHITDNNISGAGYAAIYLPDVANGGEIERNLIRKADYYGLLLLNDSVSRSFKIYHNCFMQNGIANALSRDTDGHFDDGSKGNFWDDWCMDGRYEIADIPKYDEHPMRECDLIGSCTPVEGLKMSTYDISSYTEHFPDNHEEFESLEKNYAIDSAKFGQGVFSKIDTTGNNNNPFHDGTDDKYLTIFEGFIDIPSDGNYSFAINGDDAVELIIDGKWYGGWYSDHNSDGTDHNVSFILDAGRHSIKFRHQDWLGDDSYQLYWKKPGDDDYSIVPSDAFTHCSIPLAKVDYRMDDCNWSDGHSDVRDSSGNAYDATSYNGAHTIDPTGASGVCRVGAFDGVDDYIDTRNSFDFPQNQFTVTAWIYPRSDTSGRTLFIQSDKSDHSDGFGSAFGTDAKLYFYVGDWSSHKVGISVDTNRWTHIAVTYDSNMMKIYKNGRLASCPLRARVDIDSGANLLIGDSIAGGEGAGDDLWKGYIDEFKIFDTALDATDIEEIYNYEKSRRNYDGSARYCQHCAITPSCDSLVQGLKLTTYDISSYEQSYPYCHEDYDDLENRFASASNRFGAGYVDEIDTSGNNNNPYHDGDDDFYLSIFEGYIYTEEGRYSFAVNGDDAVELIIDGDPYGWYGGHAGNGGSSHNRIYPMQKGYHSLKFRHEDRQGGDNYQLYWKKPSQSDYTIVPNSALFRCSGATLLPDGVFNAVTSAGDNGNCEAIEDWENNLTTQIVKKDFDLYILAREQNSSHAIEANISDVILNYYESGDNDTCDASPYRRESICGNGGCGKTDSNGCLKLTLKSDYSSKCSNFTIVGRRADDNSSNETRNDSSDNFAIRPSAFAISIPSSQLYAGEKFRLDFTALGADGTRAADYNETLDNSFQLLSQESKSGCENGILDTQNFSFADGFAKDSNLSYDEIGDINITIKEKSGSEFAKVDSDDTDNADRFIKQSSEILNVLPYEINITSLTLSASTGEGWLYMAHDIDDMSLTAKVTLEVYNASSQKMKDFNSSCYAKELNVSFRYDIDSAEELKLTLDGNLSDNDKNITDINKTLRIPVSLFNDAKAESFYRFGIDRNSSKAKNPLSVILRDANVTTANIAKYLHSAAENSAIGANARATFYYGRVSFKDLRLDHSPVDHGYSFEVYSDNPSDTHIDGFARSSLNWYINALHDKKSYGDIEISDSAAYKNIVLEGESLDMNITSTTIDSGGKARMHIEIAPGIHGVVHLDINDSVWLWYTPPEYAKEYDFSEGSDCSAHPCFNIERESLDNGDKDIQSGLFNAIDSVPERRGDFKQEGIKVFR